MQQELVTEQNNLSILYILGIILLVTFATAIAAYLTFNMKPDLAMAVLIMLGVAMLLDFFIIRNVLCLFIAIFLRFIAAFKNSWRFMSMGGRLMQDIHNMMKEVVMDCDTSEEDSILNIRENYKIPEADHESSGEDWNVPKEGDVEQALPNGEST